MAVSLAATECPDGNMPTTLTIPIASGEDDVEESVPGATPDELSAGALYVPSSDMELGYDNDQYEGNQYMGLRFTNVAVPPGSYIHQARVAFIVDAVGSCCNESFDITVKMQKTPNAPSFDNSTIGLLDDMFTSGATTASKTYTPELDVSVGDDASTPDLSDLVQEVVDQTGWASGNAMVVLFGDSTGSTEAQSREYESYNGDSSSAPSLVIEYCALAAPTCDDGSAPTVVSAWVSASGDDAEEAIAGATGGDVAVGELYTTSSDIELGYDDDKYTGNQYVALRFPGVSVPQGSVVQDARVKFWVDAAGSCCDAALSVTAKMQKVADAPVLTGQASGYLADMYSTGATSAEITYTPEVDNAADVHQPRYTPDLSAAVQEVVDQASWASGNAMVAIFGDATGNAEANSREYESYDTDPHLAPSIYIAYCPAPAGGSSPGSADTAGHLAASSSLLAIPLLMQF